MNFCKDAEPIQVPTQFLGQISKINCFSILSTSANGSFFCLGIMQIYLEQIALFGFLGQCIWSKCPKTHIKNLVESSAGNYA